MEYRTCNYIRDDGGICNSAAVTDRNLCLYHLQHRARLMRMAQYRARNQRYDLQLPPLESMHAVQSALTQLSEALAADMIDLKRADRLIRVLNIASRNLLKADKWPASPYHSDQPALAIDLAADYGLPQDLDLNTPPEVAFPQSQDSQSVILSEERSDESKDPFVSAQRMGGIGAPPLSPDFGDRVGVASMPTVDYCQHGPGCPEHTIRADYPITPESIELREALETGGEPALVARHKQQQRNRNRRLLTSSRKRYAAIALEKNLRLAAERLAERKLAEKQAQPDLAARKPPASAASGDTIATKEEATA